MISFIILSLCSFVFICIGVYAMRREKPMWFYSGSEEEIEKENFHDVKEYNRKNGYMWMTYGLAMFLPPLLKSFQLISTPVFGVLFIGMVVVGFLIMMIYWNHLHKKYTANEK